jgi:hypothetical protein
MTLRYGNAVSLEQSDKLGTYISAHPDKYPYAPFPEFIAKLQDDPSIFTVLREGGHATTEPVKFGDSVKLFSKGRNGQGYLAHSSSEMQVEEGESVKMLMLMSLGIQPNESEAPAWKILNPDDLTTTATVKFGDNIVFRNAANGTYLSCGFDWTRYGFSDLPVVANRECASTEKWRIGAIRPEVSHPDDFSPVMNVPSNDTSVYLPAGLTAQKAVIGALSALPEVGGGIGAVLKIFWSEPKVDIWELVKNHVRAMVQNIVFAEKLDDIKNTLEGIKTNFNEYTDVPDPLEKGIWLTNVLSDLNVFRNKICNSDRPEQTLPYLVATAVLHVTALRERCLYGAEYYSSKDGVYLGKKNHHDALLNAIDYYRKMGERARANILANRDSQIGRDKKEYSQRTSYDVRSSYWWWFWDNYNTSVNRKWEIQYTSGGWEIYEYEKQWSETYHNHRNKVMSELTQKLDKFLAPLSILPFMDTENISIPIKIGDNWR